MFGTRVDYANEFLFFAGLGEINMHDAIASFWGELPETLRNHAVPGQLLVLSSPAGGGSAQLIRAFERTLSAQKISFFRVADEVTDLVAKLSSTPAGTVLVFENLEHASEQALVALGNQVLAGAAAVGTLTHSPVDTRYAHTLEKLRINHPGVHAVFAEAHSLTVPLFHNESITRLVHAASPLPLSQVTVSAIEWLSWGRPEWAVDLLRIHERGHLEVSPHPFISQAASEAPHAESVRSAVSTAKAHLSDEQVAGAIVLAELGPRSSGGVADVIGAQQQSHLISAGFIMSRPLSSVLQGVPELIAAAIRPLASAETLRQARITAAMHLMTQEAFGIPLNSRESRFCALALDTETIVSHPNLGTHHSSFLLRSISDLIAFGDGNRARDIMLRLGHHGPQLSTLTRARISTVLRDAPTGLQTILASSPPLGNGDDPIPNSRERIAMLMLRGRLAAESGFAFTTEPRSTPLASHGRDHTSQQAEWDDAHLVIERWNDTEPLGEDFFELARIAQEHRQPEIALLAEVLLNFEAAPHGAELVLSQRADIAQRTTQIALHSGEELRDVVEGLAVAQSLNDLLNFEPGDQGLALKRLIDHLPGAAWHHIWAEHLSAARSAFLRGNLTRAKLEWQQFAKHAPRFLPYRISSFIDNALAPFMSAEAGTVQLMEGVIGQVVAYFGGHFERTRADTFSSPTLSSLRGIDTRGGSPSQQLTSEIKVREFPTLEPMRAHLRALHQANPAALLRAADQLESIGFWAPAISATTEARRIFLRRRASGSVTQADTRLKHLTEQAARSAPWFEASTPPLSAKEQLTPRETTTAAHAAQGLSNREIAELMRCSVRTVESHLAQARAKLGAADRSELTTIFTALNSESTPTNPRQHARK